MASFDLSGDRLSVSGALDANAQSQLSDHCRKLLDSGGDAVTIDLSGVEMITSVCIGTLVATWIDLNSAGKRAELVASSGVMKVLDLVGLTQMFIGGGGRGKP